MKSFDRTSTYKVIIISFYLYVKMIFWHIFNEKKFLPLVKTLICAWERNAVCLISSQWRENLLQIQSMIQQEIKPFKNG